MLYIQGASGSKYDLQYITRLSQSYHLNVNFQVPGMKEILLIGSYQPNEQLSRFITDVQQEFKILVRWACVEISMVVC